MSRRAKAVAAVLLLVLMGCGGQRQKPLTIKGSDTMVILSQRWAEQFMKGHSGSVIQVTGGGSGTGIAALINGTTEICQASRPMKDEEKQQIQAKSGQPPVEIPVAKDGLSVYVHESNPVKELTLSQVKDIYTGAIKSWKQVGGKEGPITLYGRENNSGTYVYFKEEVLADSDYAATMQSLPGTAAVVNAVAQDPTGIGYGGAAYAKGVKECAIRKDASTPGVLPTEAAVRDGSYPISRNLFYYTRTTPQGLAKEFVDFALSPEGQTLVREVGYFSIR